VTLWVIFDRGKPVVPGGLRRFAPESDRMLHAAERPDGAEAGRQHKELKIEQAASGTAFK